MKCYFGRRLVRLAGSGVAYRGRLEVFHNGRWGTVCHGRRYPPYPVYSMASVVCYQLGFG